MDETRRGAGRGRVRLGSDRGQTGVRQERGDFRDTGERGRSTTGKESEDSAWKVGL